GRMRTGWFQSGDDWYYLSLKKTDKLEKGQIVTGWLEDDGYWYFLAMNDQFGGPKGYMVKNMKIWDGKNDYFLDEKGRMRTGWFQSGDDWYYLSLEKTDKLEKGQVVTGDLDIRNSYGTIKTYHFNSKGVCTNP
ncbi:hypothetical protein OB981_28325, partial [Bacillus cereus]|nr:hypothetical protein [Bacillus cereus]